MKTIAAPELPAVLPSAPERTASLRAKWRWNVPTALFAVLLLAALSLHRWRRSEIVDRAVGKAPGIGARVAIAALVLVIGAALTLFAAPGGRVAAAPQSVLTTAQGEGGESTAAGAGGESGGSGGSGGSGDSPDSGDSANARAEFRCSQCGVVESTREIVQVAERDDRPPSAGVKRRGLAKSGGGIEVTVRMKDGASHQFVATNSENAANWRPGERVIVIAGRSPSKQ